MPTNDNFNFGFLMARGIENEDDDWQDKNMFGVPDVNGDGKSNSEDLTILTLQVLADQLARDGQTEATAVRVVTDYDADTNVVTVTATDTTSGTAAQGTYDFDTGGAPGSDTTIV